MSHTYNHRKQQSGQDLRGCLLNLSLKTESVLVSNYTSTATVEEYIYRRATVKPVLHICTTFVHF